MSRGLQKLALDTTAEESGQSSLALGSLVFVNCIKQWASLRHCHVCVGIGHTYSM